ncbi:hypothetical protein ITX44_01070 [Streptomyces sp. KK5PA1]|uniref:Uncharacterized protein n=2 Tax=Actinacidiphila acididurans TaxID=2784346 RepID=A0ABS2TJA0_9ACTN|nr:hypothetical protein [Actinacidiphila acididurans]
MSATVIRAAPIAPSSPHPRVMARRLLLDHDKRFTSVPKVFTDADRQSLLADVDVLLTSDG